MCSKCIKSVICVDKNHHSTAESFKKNKGVDLRKQRLLCTALSLSLFVKMKVAFVLALCLLVGACVHSSPLDLSSQDVAEVIERGGERGNQKMQLLMSHLLSLTCSVADSLKILFARF